MCGIPHIIIKGTNMLLIEAYLEEAVLLRRAGRIGAAARLEALAKRMEWLSRALASTNRR